jgi:hypothetical protein
MKVAKAWRQKCWRQRLAGRKKKKTAGEKAENCRRSPSMVSETLQYSSMAAWYSSEDVKEATQNRKHRGVLICYLETACSVKKAVELRMTENYINENVAWHRHLAGYRNEK